MGGEKKQCVGRRGESNKKLELVEKLRAQRI